MPKRYVIDIRHYLGEDGNLPPLPAPAIAIALLCGAVVAWVSGWPGPEGELTTVARRRSRSRLLPRLRVDRHRPRELAVRVEHDPLPPLEDERETALRLADLQGSSAGAPDSAPTWAVVSPAVSMMSTGL